MNKYDKIKTLLNQPTTPSRLGGAILSGATSTLRDLEDAILRQTKYGKELPREIPDYMPEDPSDVETVGAVLGSFADPTNLVGVGAADDLVRNSKTIKNAPKIEALKSFIPEKNELQQVYSKIGEPSEELQEAFRKRWGSPTEPKKPTPDIEIIPPSPEVKLPEPPPLEELFPPQESVKPSLEEQVRRLSGSVKKPKFPETMKSLGIGNLEDLSNMDLETFRNKIYQLERGNKPLQITPENIWSSAFLDSMVPAGTLTSEKAGGSDWKTLLKYYNKKYGEGHPIQPELKKLGGKYAGVFKNLPDIDSKTGEVFNRTPLEISIDPRLSDLQKASVLSHELGHFEEAARNPEFIARDITKKQTPEEIKDLIQSRGITKENPVRNASTDRRNEFYQDQLKVGHHRDYIDFEGDYVLKNLLKDAIDQGVDNFHSSVIARLKFMAKQNPTLQEYLNRLPPEVLNKKLAAMAALAGIAEKSIPEEVE